MESIGIGYVASVFGAGLLSFFSPCILPLLPVYLAYLSADIQSTTSSIAKKLVRALAFVAGLSTTFFLLGFGAGALGDIINNSYFFISCGLIVFLFGLYHSGLVDIPIFDREKRMQLPTRLKQGGLITAFLFGLVFSLGWTPCVGPILGSVLVIAAQHGGAFAGGLLLLVYALGLGIPFVVLTAASELLLGKIKQLNKYLPTIKLIGGLIIAALGLFMIFSQVYTLEQAHNSTVSIEQSQSEEQPQQSQQPQDGGENFTLQSADGRTVNLSDYRGKPVYIKFWATWCPSCLAGLEEFGELAKEYNDGGELAVLSVVAPGYGGEMNAEDFKAWAHAQELEFPILLDDNGEVNNHFGVRAYPTSVFFDEHGMVSENRIGDVPSDELRSILDSMIE